MIQQFWNHLGQFLKLIVLSATGCLSVMGRQHTMARTEQRQGCLEPVWLPTTLRCETPAEACWRAQTSAVIPAVQVNNKLKSLLLPKDTESGSVQNRQALMESTNCTTAAPGSGGCTSETGRSLAIQRLC